MKKKLKTYGEWLNKCTIYLVITDILLIATAWYFKDYHSENLFAGILEFLHHILTPAFIALTALFPALAAAFNALRYQSEVTRLKERSEIMLSLLNEKALLIDEYLSNNKTQLQNNGSRILETIPLIEEVEQILLDEVADWGVLYSKEVLEW